MNANHPEQDSTPKPVLLPAGQSLGKPVAQLRPVGASLSASLPEGRLTPNDDHDPSQYEGTFYAQVGGRETFRKLAEKFYESVGEDTEFRAMYPETDLRPATMRLQLFLEQYWGGPTTYSERRGHPRLRMRHAPFKIDQRGRDRWIALMEAAIAEAALPVEVIPALRSFFHQAGTFMINHP